MANYYYVKNGLGTRTSDTSFTAAESGAFGSGNLTAANVYANVADAAAYASDGDFIVCSDAHSAAYDNGGTYTLNAAGAVNGAGLTVISVSDSDCNAYSVGASDVLNDGTDEIQLDNNGRLIGMEMGAYDDGFATTAGLDSKNWKFIDCNIPSGNQTTDYPIGSMAYDGGTLDLINTTLDWNGGANTANGVIRLIANNTTVRWIGGAATSTGGGDFGSLVDLTSGAGAGGSLICIGVDLSLVGELHSHMGSITTDMFLTRLINCKLSSSVTLPTVSSFGNVTPHNVLWEMIGCDDATGSKQYRYLRVMYAGLVKNNETTYVTNTTDWYETTTGSGLEVQTNAYCNQQIPLHFEYQQYIDLSATASDKIYVNLTSSITLTDHDVYAELVYADATDKEVGHFVSTSPEWDSTNRYGAINPLASGTTLTNPGGLGSGDWTSGKTNYYSLELDTTGDAGDGQFVTVRVYVTKASITTGQVIFDSELSAG